MIPKESGGCLVNSVHLMISMEIGVSNVLRRIDNIPQYFILESLDYWDVTNAIITPRSECHESMLISNIGPSSQ